LIPAAAKRRASEAENPGPAPTMRAELKAGVDIGFPAPDMAGLTWRRPDG
jgi:hypothetical protein